MCLTQLWIYTECGCSFEHLIPCRPSFEESNAATPRRTCTSHQRSSFSPSSISFPPSPSPTDSADECQEDKYNSKVARRRECSIKHTVQKAFLEPICDECLLEELKADGNISRWHQPLLDSDGGEHLILESDVKVEVADEVDDGLKFFQPELETPSILESNVEILIEDAINEHLPTCGRTSVNNDADDEGSLRPARGRPQSRTKQLRRRGMDISRESLRISSRLSAGENGTLEAFRNTLQDQSESLGRNLLSKFAEVQRGGKTWAKNVVGDLAGSLSRGREKVGMCIRGNVDATNDSDTPTVVTRPAICTLWAIIDNEDSSVNCRSGRGSSRSINSQQSDNPTLPQHISNTDGLWQQHLQHDLKSGRSRSRRFIKIRKTPSSSSTSSRSTTYSGQNLIVANSRFIDPSYETNRVDTHSRNFSTTPSIPMTASSANSSTSLPVILERLSSVISCTDFDVNESVVQANDSEAQDSAEVTTIDENDESSSFATASPARSITLQKPKPNSDTDLALDTSSFNTLTLHPLHTPVSLTNPPIHRPPFTLRSSSLSSPWRLNTPRLGRSQTAAHFVCIWERHVCRGCGGLVSKLERGRSCVCDVTRPQRNSGSGGGGRNGMAQCRAEQPIVRYVYHHHDDDDVAEGEKYNSSSENKEEDGGEMFCEVCRAKIE